MFRNKVIKDLSSNQSTNLTKFESNAEAMRNTYQNKIRSNTAEATSGVRKPCQRFLARGNNPVAPAYEEHDIIQNQENVQPVFHHTYIDKDGNIKSLLPTENL